MAELRGAVSALALGETAKRLVAQRIAQPSKAHIDPKIPILRRQQLQEAFSLMDKDHNGTLTFAEVLDFLTSVSDRVREDYVREIYTSMDRNRDGIVSIDEFTRAYLSQVEMISEAIEDLKHHMSETKEELLKSEKELSEVQKTAGTQNKYGIRTDSRLAVTVKEAQGVSTGLFTESSYVELRYDQQSIRTANQTGKNPNWYEVFEFLVERPDSVLECKVMSKDAIGSFKLIGECRVNIHEIMDQQEHESWRQLEISNKPVPAKLLLTIKLQFDKPKQLRLAIEQLQSSHTQDQLLLNQLQDQLCQLGTSTVGLFIRDSQQFHLETRILNSADSIYPANIELYCRLRTWRVIFWSLLLVFTCVWTSVRSSLVDSVLLAGGVYWEMRGWSKGSVRRYLVGLVGSIGWDGVWLLMLLSRAMGQEDSSALSCLVLLLLSTVHKVVMCVLLAKTHSQV